MSPVKRGRPSKVPTVLTDAAGSWARVGQVSGEEKTNTLHHVWRGPGGGGQVRALQGPHQGVERVQHQEQARRLFGIPRALCDAPAVAPVAAAATAAPPAAAAAAAPPPPLVPPPAVVDFSAMTAAERRIHMAALTAAIAAHDE